MNTRSIPFNIRQYKTMYENGSLNLEHPLQRGDVWDEKRKAEFIRSLFLQLPILAIISIQEDLPVKRVVNGREVKMSSIIDGKQRILSVFQYLDDKFSTPENTTYLDNINNIECDLSGKKFSELTKSLQDTYNNFVIKILQVSDYTIDELERLLLAYNSGKQMNSKQTFKIEIGLIQVNQLNSIIQSCSFFKHISEHFSKTQKNNNEDLLSIVRTFILLSDISIKSFDFEDMLLFMKEYDYQQFTDKVKDTLSNLNLLLFEETQKENKVNLKKTDWTFYTKRLPYLIYAASVLDIPVLKELLNNSKMKYIMPENMSIKKSAGANKDFLDAIHIVIKDVKQDNN